MTSGVGRLILYGLLRGELLGKGLYPFPQIPPNTIALSIWLSIFQRFSRFITIPIFPHDSKQFSMCTHDQLNKRLT